MHTKKIAEKDGLGFPFNSVMRLSLVLASLVFFSAADVILSNGVPDVGQLGK